jgi:hypothetical protein
MSDLTKLTKAQLIALVVQLHVAQAPVEEPVEEPKARFVTKGARKDLVAEAPHFAGMSTKEVVAAVLGVTEGLTKKQVAAGKKGLPEGWAIGKGYRKLVQG